MTEVWNTTAETEVADVSEQDDEVFVFPLSFAQQRLWFLDQFEPGSPFYNIPSAVRMRGQLHVDALRQTLATIVERHETLRTAFATIDGAPMQIIAPTETCDLPIVDLRSLAPTEREAHARWLANEEARRPFDLSVGPLLRTTLLRLGETEHILLLTMHHIISDGWSMGVLVHEVAELYTAFVAGKPSPLPELAIQYADYAEWQREWLQGDVLERQLDFWRRQLGGELPVLEMPTDRVRPAVQRAVGGTEALHLSQNLVEAVTTLGRQSGATLFMTLLAAFQVLLHRYSGQDDICVGTPIANRTRPEVEPLIGCFINTLVLRGNLSGDPSFRTLLNRVKETSLGSFANQDLPFETLVEELQPERDMSHAPLFQVMFILQNAGGHQSRALPGLALEQVESSSGTSTFDLTMIIGEDENGLEAVIEYNSDLFDAPTIRRMLGHYQTLLSGIVVAPNAPITELPLLTPAERADVIALGHSFQLPLPPVTALHHLVERHAAARPNALAVIAGNDRLSYAELDARAHRLAHRLVAAGLQPAQHVAIALAYGPNLFVAVLAVWKAGGAYVPLDVAAPAARLSAILADAVPAFLITEPQVGRFAPADSPAADHVPLPPGTQRVWFDDPDASAADLVPLPAIPVAPNHPAYLIYTSGSTGAPKGVLVEHRQLLNALVAWEHAYRLEPSFRHLQLASFSFDVFVGDLTRALGSGGALALCPRDALLDPPALAALIDQQQIACAEFVPAVLRGLMNHLETTAQRLPSLKVVICGSDSWYAGEYAAYQRLLGPQTRLINSFGLTEATIDSTYFESATPLALASDQVLPIGRPYANMHAYILDPNGVPTPIGVPGELHIGGAGVARGYHNQPELTAARFVLDPFVPEAGARMYRSGDRARFLADGAIAYLGRADSQVKIRGFRIEPGEVEAVLGRHPAVQQAAVMPQRAPTGETWLVAYMTTDESAPASGELRRFAQERLPNYMVPALFVVLDAFPLLPSGKIDRRALPEPDWATRQSDDSYVAPRTPDEQQLAAIWSEVLGLGRVGIYDDFFELGGHSLLATQLVSRVRAVCNVELPLRSVFESPTIAEFAEQVELTQRGAGETIAPPIRPAPRTDRLPLSFAQQRLWFLDQIESGAPLYNIPETMRLHGALNVDALRRSLQEIVRRHETLRTVFSAEDGLPYQLILPEAPIDLPLSDLSELPVAEREVEALRLAEREARRPFDLQHGPLLRARLLRLAPDDHMVLLTIHHIISDDWSTSVLIGEIASIYDAFARGRPSPLPELPIQYADFAVWQRNWLQGETLDRQLNYWRTHLTGAPPLLELPTDRPRPPMQTFNGAYLEVVIPRKLSYAIKTLSQREGTTLFMTLLAAFSVLLARYSGQDDICIGTPIANRHRGEVENLIGFFVNTLVLRTDLSDAPSFRTLLHRVRESTLGAYAHQDLPFEMLVDALQPERDLSHSPLFQVMFALQNAPLNMMEMSDLALSDVAVHSGTAKFDLTLFLSEAGDELVGVFEYNTDLFDANTIEHMIGHFHTLLAAIAADPDASVARLPLLSAAERELILTIWNQTAAPYPHDRCIHHLLADQVARTPHALAARDARDALSYADLDARANQLAHHLQRHGVGPDHLVAILLERSLDMLVAVLATLKAGGAYLPLDGAYPHERLSFMLADARPTLLLARTPLLADHLAHDPALPPVILIDQDAAVIADRPVHVPTAAVTPDHLAYVIYTSGSTGTPKGALITHRGLVNYLWWAHHAYPHTGQGAPVHSSLAFDLTVTSLYLPLLSGGRVDLLPNDAGVEALTNALRAPGDYTLVKITPAHLDMLNQQIPPAEAARCTQAFVIGGENLASETIAFWRTHAPQTRLINEYGPTETVVGCCVYTIAPDEPLGGSVPIGRPIANTRLYVLDPQLQPTPIGVVGELYIGGVGVARGYLNRPELTAERFLPDPFAPEAGARMYKTGDLARYRSDGVLEYLGRTDHQVKIRGFRIELGEIESAIGAHPQVREAVALAREDAPGHKRLVAYLTLQEATANRAELAAEVRRDLQARLPEYIVPTAFVVLDQMPLTANGKVDRKALPAPEADRSAAGSAYRAPRDEAETLLATIWSQVLGLEQVGIHDNFFALGGDSILSLQVISRANQAGLRLAPRHIFAAPTIAELAALAGSGPTVIAEQGVVTGNLPLTPIQRWFFELDLPRLQHWNQSLLLETRVPLDRELLVAAVERLMLHHDALRLRFHRNAQGWQARNAIMDVEPPVSWIALDSIDPQAQRQALERHTADIQAGLDIEHGPVLRVAYFDFGPQQPGRLLLALHHLIVDGVSWRIILEDLHTIYQQLQQDEAIQLPLKTSSYKQWAERLAVYANDPNLLTEVAHWFGHNNLQPLPCDFPDGINDEASTAVVSVALDSDETQALLQDAPTAYRTEINDVLLTALARALCRWAGSTAIQIDLESHGREDIFDDIDISRTVGWFTALYPIQLALPADDDPGAALLAVKEQLRRIPQRGIGYGALRYLSDVSALSGQIVTEPSAVSFNYLGQFDQALPSSELFTIAAESAGSERDPNERRTHLIDINGSVAGGQLAFEWSYSCNLYRPDSIERVAADFIAELRGIVSHCCTIDHSTLTAADVADFGWDADDLAGFIDEIEG